MPVMTFIACRMFEDEIVHIVETDDSIKHLLIVDNEDSGGLVDKLNDAGCNYSLVPGDGITQHLEGDDITLVVEMLELALHATPEHLREVVYGKAREMSEYSDGILLFYGLCGNVLGKVDTELADLPCPVRILKEDNGDVIDDCIGAVLGSRAAYLEKLKSFHGVGTFFMTPMWAAHWREMVVSAGMTPDPDDIKLSKFVFDYAGYKNVAKMDTGLHYEKQFEPKVEEFAKLFEFNIIDMEASPKLLVRCYEQLKDEVLKVQGVC
ncbi:DUF1638 domain-containing protein [Methanolobus profundi]|uniref:DUF1638 domain-containing protein n=1 Tax=Methanolobus profundi TaxID=487685 RepID=A0A1I4NHT8_9EURY|nr:DUF1638 domain-containing protein [Methanolobus profundi]SFM14743.1 Protein of unknown function [Methanolobus profundi]